MKWNGTTDNEWLRRAAWRRTERAMRRDGACDYATVDANTAQTLWYWRVYKTGAQLKRIARDERNRAYAAVAAREQVAQ